MVKKSALFFILFLILPVTGFTLGLGEISVFSKLNEPLKVHIALLDSKSTNTDSIVVKNASLNTYRRANLPRPDTFKKVRFKTIKQNNGAIIVELTTKRPVREPFVTFIADLKWRTGHINREYTFLLDPPEFIQKQIYTGQSKKISTLKKTTVKTASVSAPPRKQKHRKIDYSSVIANHIDGNTYETKNADTLWGIAKKVKPGKNVTTYQTMQALFALNPQAFIKNNIDLLKTGQTLKIPTENEIRQINGKPPLKDSAAQPDKSTPSSKATLSQQQKSSLTTEATADTNTQKNLTPNPPAAHKDAAESQAQLKIIPPSEELLNAPVTSREDLILINRALQNSITTIQSLKNENDKLSSQINTLTEKLNALDNDNLSLNDKLADITVQLNKQQIAPDVAAQQQSNQTVSPESNNSNTQAADNTGSVSQSDASTLEIDSQLVQSDKSTSVTRSLLTSPAVTITLAVLTIIILTAALLTIRSQNKKRKQRKENSYVPYPLDDITKPSRPLEAVKSQKNKTQKLTPTSLQGTDIGNEDETNEDDMDFFEYFEKKINAPDTSSSTSNSDSEQTSMPATADENHVKAGNHEASEISFDLDISSDDIEAYEKSIADPEVRPSDNLFGEIDTYLAYGNYLEAEKLLNNELQKAPLDKNLHLKLFESYSHSNKRNEFIRHAENNLNLLNMDMVLRHRVENIFEKTWNESLNFNTE